MSCGVKLFDFQNKFKFYFYFAPPVKIKLFDFQNKFKFYFQLNF